MEQRSDLDIFLTQEANAVEAGGDESPSWQEQKLLADQDDLDNNNEEEVGEVDKAKEEEKGKYVLLVDQEEFEWKVNRKKN